MLDYTELMSQNAKFKATNLVQFDEKMLFAELQKTYFSDRLNEVGASLKQVY